MQMQCKVGQFANAWISMGTQKDLIDVSFRISWLEITARCNFYIQSKNKCISKIGRHGVIMTGCRARYCNFNREVRHLRPVKGINGIKSIHTRGMICNVNGLNQADIFCKTSRSATPAVWFCYPTGYCSDCVYIVWGTTASNLIPDCFVVCLAAIELHTDVCKVNILLVCWAESK